jgi:hypothetical protein
MLENTSFAKTENTLSFLKYYDLNNTGLHLGLLIFIQDEENLLLCSN